MADESTVSIKTKDLKVILSIVDLCFWFVGALIYLLMLWKESTQLEKIVVLLSICIPIVPGVILILNALDIIKLK